MCPFRSEDRGLTRLRLRARLNRTPELYNSFRIKNMSFITEEEMKDRLKKDNLLDRLNGKKEFEVLLPSNANGAGRKEGDKTMPDFLQEVIGVLGRTEDQRGVAKVFGISQPHVQQLSTGKNNGTIDLLKKDRVDAQLSRIRDRAVDKLMNAMGLMTDGKMQEETAKDLSGIAANMSKVVQVTLPKEVNDTNLQQVIIYAPETQAEDFYQIKELE